MNADKTNNDGNIYIYFCSVLRCMDNKLREVSPPHIAIFTNRALLTERSY